MRVVRGMLAIEVNPEALPEKNGAVQVAVPPWQMAFLIHSGCTERYLKTTLSVFFNYLI